MHSQTTTGDQSITREPHKNLNFFQEKYLLLHALWEMEFKIIVVTKALSTESSTLYTVCMCSHTCEAELKYMVLWLSLLLMLIRLAQCDWAIQSCIKLTLPINNPDWARAGTQHKWSSQPFYTWQLHYYVIMSWLAVNTECLLGSIACSIISNSKWTDRLLLQPWSSFLRILRVNRSLDSWFPLPQMTLKSSKLL